jgi:predicted transcriptional regulator
MVTVRVSEVTYRKLNKVAGRMRRESGRPVSMNDVVEHLLKRRGLKLSDLQGAWKND